MILSEGLSLALLVRSIGALGIRVTFPHLGRLLLAGALLIAAVLPWYRHVVFPDLPRNALALALGAAAIGSSYLLIVRALRIFDARMEWDRLR
jgi:drug/metabolite transporter (DMT)-like permease